MNKILIYLTLLAGVALFASCNLNETPEFNDEEAFVAFGGTSFSAQETDAQLKVPVRLTSLNNLSSTVTFEVFDSTAVAGRDYALSGGATVLNFDGKNPVQEIEFDILPHEGVFTGDRVFGIALKSAGSVNLGSNDTVYVKILDLDHPLSAILGDYTVYGPNFFSGRDATWTVKIEKDEAGDITKVWISNLVVAGTSEKVYGIVNEDMTKIEIPVKQTIATSSSYNSIVLEGFDDPDIDVAGLMPDGSKLTMNLTQESPIMYTIDLPFGSHIVDVDSWYSIVTAGATFTKK
jgi:hypothetical protein